MIEKVDPLRDNFLTMVKKHNALVDAFNELHEEAENNARIRADHEHKIEALQDNQNTYWTDIAEIKKELQTRAENVQSDAESRPVNVHAVCPAVKYMGKVCRFWNGGNGKKFKNIGVLIEILSADNKRRYTCASKPKKHFEFCEPVKPDDDIIYKGADNE